jgi:hypothetical protein
MKKKQPINATYGILLFLLLSWQPSHSQILAMVQQTKQTETSKNDSKKALGSILVDLEGIYRANIFFELNTVENIFVNPKIISTGLSLEENLQNIFRQSLLICDSLHIFYLSFFLQIRLFSYDC